MIKKEDLIKKGWKYIEKNSICPDSMQVIDYGYHYKDSNDNDFYIKHYQDDDILRIYTYNKERTDENPYYINSEVIKTIEDVNNFINKETNYE